MSALEIREQFNELLQTGRYMEIRKLFDLYADIVGRKNDLAIARLMFSVFEQEKEEGKKGLYEKVESLDEIVNRYTKLMFYLRRFEFDIMDSNIDEFNRFLKTNQISSQELFAVMYCGNINREKVLQIIQDKMVCGEITL